MKTPWKFWLVMLGGIVGCGKSGPGHALDDTCVSLGLCEAQTVPPVFVDVLIDASEGSSGNRQTLARTLDAVLRFTADRPGSRQRLWVLGKDVGSTSMVVEQVTPKAPKGSDRAKKSASERFVGATRDLFIASASQVLDSSPIKRSPLAEAITKIALSDDSGIPRSLVIITDAREVSEVGTLECAKLPTADAFLKALQKNRVMGSGTLAGIDIYFTFVEFKPVASRSCPITLERDQVVRQLWSAALAAAGAPTVHFSAGPVVFTTGDGEKDGVTR